MTGSNTLSKTLQGKYSGPNRSGICICGHSWENHHLMLVMRMEYIKATGEGYGVGACEHYGSNEMEGYGPDGEIHCLGYRDTMDNG